jgi:thioester reductase-like protein
VHCLVRASSPAEGLKKLRQSLEKYDLWQNRDTERIVPVLGDLSESRLGLSDDQFEVLSSSIDVIYHNGALVNGLYPYQMLKAANVLGTQEILRLACRARVKPVHYVSTISVFTAANTAGGRAEEIWTVEGGNLLRGGYPQSKWVAERLVTIAADRGLPVVIYRPGRVSGDSKTGAWVPDRPVIDAIQTVVDVGSVPRMEGEVPIELVPVNYVAQAIVYLSQVPQSIGKAFHLANPNPVDWRELIQSLRVFGVSLRQLDPELWMAELVKFVRQTPQSYLSPMLPLVPAELLSRLENLETVAAAPAVPGVQIPPFHIDCTITLQALKDSSVVCPPVAELLDVYFSYFEKSGLLVRPTLKAST